MSLTPPPPATPRPRRQIPLALFAAAVVLVAAVSIGATAAYFELHPSTSSTGSGLPEVVATIPVGAAPEGLAYDPTNDTVFVANSGSDNVSVLSAATDRLLATIPVGAHPEGVAYDTNDSEIFVANAGSNTVTVVSAINFSFVASIPVGTEPAGVVYDSGTGEAFVANEVSDNVSVISNLTNEVVRTIHVGTGPTGLAYDFAKSEVFVANSGSDNVSVISDATNSTVATVEVGSAPSQPIYDAAAAEVLVTNGGSDNVSAISDASNQVVRTTPLGSDPSGITPDTERGEVFAANKGSNNVSVISEATGQVVTSLGVGSNPDGLAYDATDGQVFVTNFASNSVSVISDRSNVAVTDDLGRVVTVPLDPQRIVVLAPSVMDMVYRLGLRSDVVGVGCDALEPGGIFNEYSPNQTALWSLSNASCITDYPELNTGDVALLGPQVVLAATITSAQAVDQLTQVYGIPVVIFGPSSLWGIVSDVRIMAEIFPDSVRIASQLEASLNEALANASALDTEFADDHVTLPTVLLSYYFDAGAYYTYGPGSFGDSLISLAGGVNIAADVPLQYAGLNATVALLDQPQVILYGTSNDSYLVSGETQSVWATAPYWAQLNGTKISVDITLVSESDPSMIYGLPLLMHWLHPTLVPLP